VVGAPSEAGSGSGVDPLPNELAQDAGAAYVFVRVGGLWSEEARLKASNSGSGDSFGYRVAISGDTVVVGAPSEAGSGSGVDPLPNELAQDAGAAYVFARTMAGWAPQATLKSFDTAARERFGSSVAIDGDTIAVGSTGDGYVDTGDPMTDVLGSGAAFVYARTMGVWSTYQKLVAPNGDPGDQLGDSVGVSGDTIVVGANGEDGSGTTVDAPDDDAQIERGAAYVFVLSAGTWTLQAYLKPTTAAPSVQFGIAAAISGDTIVVGTPNQNVLHLFARTGSSWAAAGTLTAPAPGSVGSSVGIDGDTVVAGAPADSGSGTGIDPPHDLLLEWSGAAYVGR
jgi:hypothetical protein